MAHLILVESFNAQSARIFLPIRDGVYTFGREKRCSYQIGSSFKLADQDLSRGISRIQATMTIAGDVITICDGDINGNLSVNGIRTLGGEKIEGVFHLKLDSGLYLYKQDICSVSLFFKETTGPGASFHDDTFSGNEAAILGKVATLEDNQKQIIDQMNDLIKRVDRLSEKIGHIDRQDQDQTKQIRRQRWAIHINMIVLAFMMFFGAKEISQESSQRLEKLTWIVIPAILSTLFSGSTVVKDLRTFSQEAASDDGATTNHE